MSDNQKKLLKILCEMFQFDQADLDFGIYRIMRMKHEEIGRFVNEDLPAQISEGLNELAELDTATDIAAIDKQIADTKAGNLSEATKATAVAELEEKKKAIAGSVNVASVEADVYNHLANFFSRYYDDGDFISQRRYKDGAYAIPYEGEEVKLHWANADQYYVKTSEYFKDYTFKTMHGKTVHFKLIEAETDWDNNKAKEKRFFQLHVDKPFEVIDEVLCIYVEYKNGGKKNQAECTAEIVSAFLAVQTQTEYQPFSDILSITDNKSLLERQLNRYTARNTFDYFIHKDLGKFLLRELDFYIKNDVIFLDDIDERDEAKTKAYLTKAKVIRKIARKVIAFLAQIEDFQKKLYLKKKFVVETNYCITLDRVPETMYLEIATNEAQREEWVRLFAIDEIEGTDGDLVNAATLAYSVPLIVDFLKQNPFLVLDTAFFSAEFKERLVDSIDSLDENLDGLMIHSENSQGLRLIRERYKNKVNCVYIDPPYNTSASEILYKNSYKKSSWSSFIIDRLRNSMPLMSMSSLQCVTIDDFQLHELYYIIKDVFGEDNILGTVAIKNNPSGRSTESGFSIAHEYGIFTTNTSGTKIGRLERTEEQINRYDESDDVGYFEWVNFRKHGGYKEDAPTMYYPIYVTDTSFRIPCLVWNEERNSYEISEQPQENETILYPIDENGRERRWKWGLERAISSPDEMCVKKDRQGNIGVYIKSRLNDEGILPLTVWDKSEYSSTANGTNLLKNLFGNNNTVFSYPKSIYAVIDTLKVLKAHKKSIVLDYFAGSGTTGHAVVNLNRKDAGKRKYILIEMGEYFNTATKPRVQKVIYSMDTDAQKGWKDGKPVSRKGTSHAFKYIRLESYEDVLNNIILRSGECDMFAEAREGYMLSYMLDNESLGSNSLLNVEKLDKPFSYKMGITQNLESLERTIDLVETFNYLIGLTVKKSHALVSYDADFATGEYGAVSAALKAGDAYKFKAVEGTVTGGDKTLVLWREMTGDIEKDNAVLDAYFLSFPNARSFRRVYVNCDNNLLNLRGNGESWQVVLIDEEMKKRMFEDAK